MAPAVGAAYGDGGLSPGGWQAADRAEGPFAGFARWVGAVLEMSVWTVKAAMVRNLLITDLEEGQGRGTSTWVSCCALPCMMHTAVQHRPDGHGRRATWHDALTPGAQYWIEASSQSSMHGTDVQFAL